MTEKLLKWMKILHFGNINHIWHKWLVNNLLLFVLEADDSSKPYIRKGNKRETKEIWQRRCRREGKEKEMDESGNPKWRRKGDRRKKEREIEVEVEEVEEREEKQELAEKEDEEEGIEKK